MLTNFDKALVAILPGLIAWINQKWGLTIDASPATIAVVVGFFSSILVYLVPNKET
jgi:hypothetical protein